MNADIFDILNGLEKVLPILGTISGNSELAVLAGKLLNIAEAEIERRSQAANRTRSEVLADAEAAYAEAREENAKLRALGHELD